MDIIPSELYKKIVESVPILCVDVILVHDGKFILVQRTEEPLKDEWWIVGGRALKGEKTINAAKRKVKEELGLKTTRLNLVAVYEDSYEKSAWGVPTSSVSLVYWGEVKNYKPKPNKTISDVKLSNYLPRRLLNRITYI